MSRNRSINQGGIFVQASRLVSNNQESEYVYNISHAGNFEMEELTSDEVRELITCLQRALIITEEGGKQ
jgi:hypothetical protein|nr:MAG TPA: hypothetical protein [Caudoviricetes sp.]